MQIERQYIDTNEICKKEHFHIIYGEYDFKAERFWQKFVQIKKMNQILSSHILSFAK